MKRLTVACLTGISISTLTLAMLPRILDAQISTNPSFNPSAIYGIDPTGVAHFRQTPVVDPCSPFPTCQAPGTGTPLGQFPAVNVLSLAPAQPTATSSLTPVQMGLGTTCFLTPAVRSRMMITINGGLVNNTIADGTQVQISFGTGTAPANGAAPTGTTLGAAQRGSQDVASNETPFSVTGIATGLTIGTPVWVDLQAASLVGGSSIVKDLTCSLAEM